MLVRISPIALAISSAIVLSACGGGGSSSSGTATPASVDVTVTPSLGKFSTGCSVEVRKSSGELLGSAPITSTGAAIVKITADYAGPIIAQVKGAATGCTYFDEATGTDKPFGVDKQLSAITDGVRTNLGVNALTNLSAARLLDGNKLATNKTTDDIKSENATVQLMFQVGDMFAPPTLIGTATDTIDNTQAGKLAAKLAALAEIAKTLSKDVAVLAAELATDLQDGKLDNIDNAKLQAGLTAAINKLADATSKPALLDLPGNTTLRTDVTTVKSDADKVLAAGSALEQAKQIFADLRTSIMSISNDASTGSLDQQNALLQDDFKSGVDIIKTLNYLSLITEASTELFDGTSTEVSNDGGYCYLASAKGAICYLDSNQTDKSYEVKLDQANSSVIWSVTRTLDHNTGAITTLNGLTGTLSRSGDTTTLVGNFYPMTGDAAKTAVNLNYTYSGVKGQQIWSGSGTLNAIKADDTTSTLKFEATEVAISETNKTAKFVAALTSPHHRFDGTLTLNDETTSIDGNKREAKNATFVGNFVNTATNSKILDGTLTASQDFSSYNSTLDTSASNYKKSSFSFKGSAYKASNIVGIGLDLTINSTSFTQRTAEFTFTGTNALTIKGSGTQVHSVDGNSPSTWTLTNANGVSATYDDATKSGRVLKADGTTLGTISSQRVTFIDGTFESLI